LLEAPFCTKIFFHFFSVLFFWRKLANLEEILFFLPVAFFTRFRFKLSEFRSELCDLFSNKSERTHGRYEFCRAIFNAKISYPQSRLCWCISLNFLSRREKERKLFFPLFCWRKDEKVIKFLLPVTAELFLFSAGK
jgi:hypothetical protein